MIKFTDNKDDIIKCWQEAFGDSTEDILFFIHNTKNAKCLSYYDESGIKAMLYLVKCNLGYYIYAACTPKKYRKNGYMSKLLEFAKDNYSPVCLIPAEQWLVNYYQKRGFTDTVNVDELTFDESDEIKEYLFEGCQLETPIALMYSKNFD